MGNFFERLAYLLLAFEIDGDAFEGFTSHQNRKRALPLAGDESGGAFFFVGPTTFGSLLPSRRPKSSRGL